MCLFPLPNNNFSGQAYKKGVKTFNCGACPECLRSRQNLWALRAYYEAMEHEHNCMITLTYDNYERDSFGRIIGELPPDRDIHVDKSHIQKFIKRLRKWYGKPLKYICAAEYGKCTGRAHYHLILFGVKFPDASIYKKSRRGHRISVSPILNRLWGKGICSVDTTNVTPAVGAYCTKYCAKARGSDDTFMLFSQRLGLKGLLSNFNGISYIVEGREHPVPRVVWQRIIFERYKDVCPLMDYHYVNHNPELRDNPFADDSKYLQAQLGLKLYYAVRDSDMQYCNYLDYWRLKNDELNKIRLSEYERILALPDNKYLPYKVKALECYFQRKRFIPAVAPGSNCISAYYRWKDSFYRNNHLPYPSCYNRASDTISLKKEKKDYLKCPFDGDIVISDKELIPISSNIFKKQRKEEQINIDFD